MMIAGIINSSFIINVVAISFISPFCILADAFVLYRLVITECCKWCCLFGNYIMEMDLDATGLQTIKCPEAHM